MLRPPTIPTALSITNSLLCIRWLTRPNSAKKLIMRQRRFLTGLKKRISMLGWASSAAMLLSLLSDI